MKRLQNTLFVTTQGAYLTREGETVSVKIDKQTVLRIPIHTLESIACFGRVSCSPPLMQLCGERQVLISFFSESGRFWARVQGPVSGNVLLRKEQYRRSDDEQHSAAIARAAVVGKVLNARTALQRRLRDHGDKSGKADLEAAVKDMGAALRSLEFADTLDLIRGCEGNASRIYFSVFDHLILNQKEDFFFRQRSRRPPLDNMNAMLSFLYSMLTNDAVSALEGVGLDPAVGFLHRDRPGRPSLALDLMEEFRSVLADRLALSLVNRKQVKAAGFCRSETGATEMDEQTRKTVIVAYQERKREKIRHPFLNENLEIGQVVHAQALLLSRLLRGDLDGYPPFLWK